MCTPVAASTGRRNLLSSTHGDLLVPQICINIHPDAVPPIHAESYPVATDKPPPSPKMATSFGLFLATIYNQSQLAERKHIARCWLINTGNSCSIKRTPLSVSYYNEISGSHIWRGLYGGGVLPDQYYPCGWFLERERQPMNHTVLQSLDRVSGMTWHRPCVHHPVHSDSFKTH